MAAKTAAEKVIPLKVVAEVLTEQELTFLQEMCQQIQIRGNAAKLLASCQDKLERLTKKKVDATPRT